jgi:hypothetical protein
MITILVVKSDGLIFGEIAELDIGAQGSDIAELIREITHAIVMDYEIAKTYNKEPFANPKLGITPKRRAFLCGRLSLPEEVEKALLKSLKIKSPRFIMAEVQ